MIGRNEINEISNPNQIINQLFILKHNITPIIMNEKKNIFEKFNLIIKKGFNPLFRV